MSTASNAAVANSSESMNFYLIGELAQLSGVKCSAIRFYERQGLLAPARHGRMRTYLQGDVERLKIIVELRDFGMPLKTIRSLLHQIPLAEDWHDSEDVKSALRGLERELLHQKAQIDRQLAAVAGKLRGLAEAA